MKNSIFRSYARKILKSEAIVSLVIVFVLALGIIGTSYALYMDVDTDTDYQLVKVGDLLIGFDEGNSTISLENMTPTDDEIGKTLTDNIFSFYIFNKGTYTANYKIKLVEDTSTTDASGNAIKANEVDPNYINFQICKDNYQNCNEVENLESYVVRDVDGNITEFLPIYQDELSPNKTTDETNPSAYYFLRMWINSNYTVEESKTIRYKVVVEATNASGLLDNKNTLAGAILNNDKITINNTEPDLSTVATYKLDENGNETTEELGLYKTLDDYGVTYYFRGAQSNNYVSFAGFTWRIVRINGDGSIRLILNSSLDKTMKDGVAVGNTTFYNPGNNDNAYLGYMYGNIPSTSYDDAHQNLNDSLIKQEVDRFYENHLIAYQEYLADTMFCGDKSLASGNEENGYATIGTNYGIYDRLIDLTPTLKCAEGENNTYSRYTSVIDLTTTTNTGVTVNNDLKYPIALLSADELFFSGAFTNKENFDYYLYNSDLLSHVWATMTPIYYIEVKDDDLNAHIVGVKNDLSKIQSIAAGNRDRSVRPVINLKADVLVAGGEGTSTSPYTVKLY